MKREIKFRGWGTQRERWFYGELNFTDEEKSDPEIVYYADENDDWYCGWASEGVYEDSVGQFTGIRDVFGHEIYDGDYLRGTIGKGMLKVVWDDANCRFVMMSTNEDGVIDHIFMLSKWMIETYRFVKCGNEWEMDEP